MANTGSSFKQTAIDRLTRDCCYRWQPRGNLPLSFRAAAGILHRSRAEDD